MGIEYELFKPDKNERYDLGKGMWSSVFPVEKGIQKFLIRHFFRNSFDLYCALLEKVAYGFNENLTLSFFKELADDLFQWCGEDYIQFYDYDLFNDYYWVDKTKTASQIERLYPYTGCIYTNKEKYLTNWKKLRYLQLKSVRQIRKN